MCEDRGEGRVPSLFGEGCIVVTSRRERVVFVQATIFSIFNFKKHDTSEK